MRIGLILAGLAGLAFGVGFLLTALMLFPTGDGDAIVTVPDVRGVTLDEARRVLDQAGLPMERGSVLPHPQSPAGSVLAQSPLPGQETVEGSPVRVTISAGASRRTIPNLDGMPVEGATRALEAAGFTVETEEVEDRRQAGTVIAARPQPGTQVELPHTVRLRVSGGPPRVTVPDVAGMDQNEARRVLESAGLDMGAVEYNRFSWEPEGTVLAQFPDAGQEADEGAAVDVVVSGRRPAGVRVRPPDEGAAVDP